LLQVRLSVFIEGGAYLQQSCIDGGYWDEARVITNEALQETQGLAAPRLSSATSVATEHLLHDRIETYLYTPIKTMEENQ
jgi:diaminohydroxyphosphoribosylaminopyrimidine deaminase/5-amino-6-(5-phosphoribosylamino)uracil reductase